MIEVTPTLCKSFLMDSRHFKGVVILKNVSFIEEIYKKSQVPERELGLGGG